MFAKLLVSGVPVISDNLFEFKCRDCGSLHRFNIAGELVETVVPRP
jgi:hypothetical protein